MQIVGTYDVLYPKQVSQFFCRHNHTTTALFGFSLLYIFELARRYLIDNVAAQLVKIAKPCEKGKEKLRKGGLILLRRILEV